MSCKTWTEAKSSDSEMTVIGSMLSHIADGAGLRKHESTGNMRSINSAWSYWLLKVGHYNASTFYKNMIMCVQAIQSISLELDSMKNTVNSA